MTMIHLKKFKPDYFLVGLTIFFNGLGFVLSVAGINIVYILAILSIGIISINAALSPQKVGVMFDQRKRFMWCLFIVWIIYALVQSSYAVDKELYSIGVGQLITNFLVVIFILYLFDFLIIDSLDAVYKAVFMILLVNTLLGLVEAVFGIHFVQASSIWDANHVRGLCENVNEYATTMYCAIVILSTINMYKRKISLFSISVVILGTLCIIKSTSRGIVLAIIIFVILYLFARLYFKYLAGAVILLKITVIIICALVVISVISGSIADIISMLITKYSGSGNDLSDFYRWHLIEESVKCFTRSNGFGVGPGQSIYYLNMNVHNFFFEILAEYGIVFFSLFVGLFIYVWIGSFNLKISIRMRSLYFALIPSMAISSISSSSIFKFKLFWIEIVILYLFRRSNFDNKVENFNGTISN